MTRDNLVSKISIEPNICFGKPCIRGYRIWVSLILDFLAGEQPLRKCLYCLWCRNGAGCFCRNSLGRNKEATM